MVEYRASKGDIAAAGGVVFRRRKKDGSPLFLLVHRPRYKDWTFPKGKLDKGESFIDAAVREVAEETGVDPEVHLPLGTVTYTTGNKNNKVVRYWLMEGKKEKFKPNREVDRVLWLSGDQARLQLTYDRSEKLLQWAETRLEKPDDGKVYLVRHAKAGRRKDFSGADIDRPLSKTGRKQAVALGNFLAGYPLMRLATSPALRCRETLDPLATTMALPAEVEGSLAEGSSPELVAKHIGTLAGSTSVLITHGDVIANLVGMLRADGVKLKGPHVSAKGDIEKGGIWVLRTRGRKIRKARYVPPPVRSD
ncbi:MAG: NUDIX hydrolase [Acidimicrobiia bacterium]|nr:NUDIX hydrolase [Acidimicrobiia bacterium]NNC75400.1 NUDIX hydrolase [Acidimicrobiia bacterium]